MSIRWLILLLALPLTAVETTPDTPATPVIPPLDPHIPRSDSLPKGIRPIAWTEHFSLGVYGSTQDWAHMDATWYPLAERFTGNAAVSRGFLAEAEVGYAGFGGALGLGFDFGRCPFHFGQAFKAKVLRSWHDTDRIEANRTYFGPEIEFTLCASVQVSWLFARDAKDLFNLSLGWRF